MNQAVYARLKSLLKAYLHNLLPHLKLQCEAVQ